MNILYFDISCETLQIIRF